VVSLQQLSETAFTQNGSNRSPTATQADIRTKIWAELEVITS
jgi:hypothetical protein